MKKRLIWCMIVICCFGMVSCGTKMENQESQTEIESFVALEKDEIVTSKHKIEKLSWESENSYQ